MSRRLSFGLAAPPPQADRQRDRWGLRRIALVWIGLVVMSWVVCVGLARGIAFIIRLVARVLG